MFFISLIYILDFALNEKYDVESYLIDTFVGNHLLRLDIDESKINPDINPKVDFNIALMIKDYNNITELMNNTFLVYDDKFYKGFLYKTFYKPFYFYYLNLILQKKLLKLILDIIIHLKK